MIKKYEFKVCIHCMTYNQVNYIGETLNGFAIQKTSFPFVAVVQDDSSTDGESEYLSQYIKDNFDITGTDYWEKDAEYATIKFARHKENNNFYLALYLLKYNHYSKNLPRPFLKDWYEKAEYFSICEGDDYWCVPNLLQSHVDYLESNPECSLIYSPVYVYEQSRGKIVGVHGRERKSYEERLMKGCYAPTLTMLCRMSDFMSYERDIRPSTQNWTIGDIPLFLYLGTRGYGKMTKEVMGVYRKLTESASHSKDDSKVIDNSLMTRNIFLYFLNRFPVDPFAKYEERIKSAHLYRVFRHYHNRELPVEYKKEIKASRDRGFQIFVMKTMIRFPFLQGIGQAIANVKHKAQLLLSKPNKNAK